ncbi:phenylacetic acid degradation protein PaaN [Allopusillimonas soli]|uniref:Phenylacetic acid degradation protein PaaN n=1 Tax=Allopusillimonas soli TaxID=659016 RepID=A0A853F450_9BURK|nr:phenylacetic acid degradation protein PaaN [Allopusillimonas soli]NYT35274.1 phenylacetic acid degradation protein PaaN [Allopusillimonas soli]TEA75698.1 phenylacetic acid degradation protein PaaN [Allopusillimonas soli]
MPTDFFTANHDMLDGALAAIAHRGYWTPFPESPSPRVYGESAQEEGRAAFARHRNSDFMPDQQSARRVGEEVSPYGDALGVRYPHIAAPDLVARSEAALGQWRDAGPRVWVGVALEALKRLNRRSMEIAHAVQHTTGQGFMMAFQAGGPHAQDRGLEAVAYAWQAMQCVPAEVQWEKPQGKHDPIRMAKRFTIVPRGVALVIGCATFPTWNGYPGLFASLATGNTVIVKPHPGATLPLAITVQILRDVLAEAGQDPDTVLLAAHEARDDMPARLALDPAVRLIDFTGSSEHGNWLETHARQAQVYTEKAGVNQVIIDSVHDIKSVARNLAFSFALYSGQMCTAPQNIYVPRGGIASDDGHLAFDEVAAALAQAVEKLIADPARAVEITGAIQSGSVLQRIDQARALGLPVLCDSRPLAHPAFPQARTRTPLLLKADAKTDRDVILREWFGPIVFVVATDSTDDSIALAAQTVRERGALTLACYTTDDAVARQARRAAERSGVALSLNLCGPVFVNQTAAYSDYHGTGANPAANAALSDAAYVSNRFRVVQTRWHV